MIESKLYCIEAKYALDDEAYTLHTVGVDMDEKTAQFLASQELGLEKELIEVLAYYEVLVPEFDIYISEKEITK